MKHYVIECEDLVIEYEETGARGRYSARAGDIFAEAELTVAKLSDAVVSANHTYVPEVIRGLGIADALVATMIRDARRNGQRVIPRCPFVRAYADKRREELADVIQW